MKDEIMSKTPTAEALKAAKEVHNGWHVIDEDLQATAQRIDVATGLPAILAERDALREALENLLNTRCFRNDLSPEHHAALDKCRAAIAKAP